MFPHIFPLRIINFYLIEVLEERKTESLKAFCLSPVTRSQSSGRMSYFIIISSYYDMMITFYLYKLGVGVDEIILPCLGLANCYIHEEKEKCTTYAEFV